MSIETYEKLVGKFELYKLIDEGLDAMEKNLYEIGAYISKELL